MVRMNFIFIFISSSDTNLLRKKSVKQKIKKLWPYFVCFTCEERKKTSQVFFPIFGFQNFRSFTILDLAHFDN